MRDERRFFDRAPLELSLLVRLEKDGSVIDAQISDLGAKGLGVVSKDMIPSEGEVKLKVGIPEREDFLNLAGNIVWSKEYFPDGWRAGLALKEQSIDLVTFSMLLDKARR